MQKIKIKDQTAAVSQVLIWASITPAKTAVYTVMPITIPGSANGIFSHTTLFLPCSAAM